MTIFPAARALGFEALKEIGLKLAMSSSLVQAREGAAATKVLSEQGLSVLIIESVPRSVDLNPTMLTPPNITCRKMEAWLRVVLR